ncbi:MAG TPA: hypothetical protein VMN38_11490 [Sphingomicrobium sp.]|nr:hypothetical protein [Sphingomicrobium sp.]
MSRVVNLSMAEADVREQCRKAAIGVSSLEVLQSGGVRLVTSSVDGAEKIRKKLKSKLVRGDVQRTPATPRTWPW